MEKIKYCNLLVEISLNVYINQKNDMNFFYLGQSVTVVESIFMHVWNKLPKKKEIIYSSYICSSDEQCDPCATV